MRERENHIMIQSVKATFSRDGIVFVSFGAIERMVLGYIMTVKKPRSWPYVVKVVK